MGLEISDIAEVPEPGHTRTLRLARCAARRGFTEVLLGSLSQLGRQPSEIMARIFCLRHKGVRIFLKSDEIGCAPIDRSVPALLTALSTLERQETARRTSRAVHSARARGSSTGRPAVMTPERQVIAARMLSQGKRGPQVLRVISGLGGPNISQSAYYLWQKAWLAGDGAPAR